MRYEILTVVASTLILSTAVSAQQGTVDSGSPVAENYANTYRVSVDEANRRLGQLAEITRVEKALTERFPEQFGGLYVEHEPGFRVVVKMTGNGEGLLRQVTNDPLFVVEKAEVPLKLLRELQERVVKRIESSSGYAFAVESNIWEGKVIIRTTDEAALEADLPQDLKVNKNVRIVKIDAGMQNTATIYGGRLLTGTTQYCTAGFNVLASGTPMILTAGHCDDRMTLDGQTFNVVERVYKSSSSWGFDMQIMKATSTHTYPNEAYKQRSYREIITKTYFASDLPLGWSVCAFGAKNNPTGIRCGPLQSKWEATKDNRGITGQFMRASSPDSNPFVIGGDSGGPVLIQNSAVGIIKGRGDTNFPNDMYFADILNIQAYGGFQYYDVTVKTSP